MRKNLMVSISQLYEYWIDAIIKCSVVFGQAKEIGNRSEVVRHVRFLNSDYGNLPDHTFHRDRRDRQLHKRCRPLSCFAVRYIGQHREA